MKTIWWTNTKVAFLCNAAITRARQRQAGISLLAQTPHWLYMLAISPFQATLTMRCNKNILFPLPSLQKAVKCSTLNCTTSTVHYPSSPAVTQSNSGIRKTGSTGMWPKFVFPANTLSISLNRAAGSFKALMAITPAGDFYPLLGQLLRNASNHTLSCSSVSPRLCTGTLQTPVCNDLWINCVSNTLRKINF